METTVDPATATDDEKKGYDCYLDHHHHHLLPPPFLKKMTVATLTSLPPHLFLSASPLLFLWLFHRVVNKRWLSHPALHCHHYHYYYYLSQSYPKGLSKNSYKHYKRHGAIEHFFLFILSISLFFKKSYISFSFVPRHQDNQPTRIHLCTSMHLLTLHLYVPRA